MAEEQVAAKNEEYPLLQSWGEQAHQVAEEELVRLVSCAKAEQACDEEQLRRVEEGRACLEKENSQRAMNLREVNEQVDAEQKRRVKVGLPTEEPFFAHISVLANEAARRVHKSLVLEEEERERSRRVQDATHRLLTSQLQRELNQRAAALAVNAEQQRRAQVALHENVIGELGRQAQQKEILSSLEIERERLMLANEDFPYGRFSEGKSTLLQNIASVFNCKKTLAAEKSAREERAWTAAYQDSALQAARVVNQKYAAQALDGEACSARARHHFATAASRAAETARAQHIFLATQNRKEELTTNQNVALKNWLLSPQVHDTMLAINRRGNQARAAIAMDLEQRMRVTKLSKQHALEELERVVARQHIAKQVELEYAHAMHVHRFRNVLDQVERHFTIKTVAVLTELECQARVKAGLHEKPRVDAQLLEAIERRGNQHVARVLASLEQERRIATNAMHRVQEELVRTMNRRQAERDIQHEQESRVVRMKAGFVFEELGRKRNRADAAKAAELARKERQELAAADMARRQTSTAVQQLLVELQRYHNVRMVTAAAEIERQTRVFRTIHDKVLEDLERELNRSCAARAVDLELAQQESMWKGAFVLEELERFHNQNIAQACAECGFQERILASSAPDAATKVDVFHEVLEQLERQGAQRRALLEMTREQERRVRASHYTSVMLELERSYNVRIVKQAVLSEQCLRVNTLAFYQVVAQLERLRITKEAQQSVAKEQVRRVLERGVAPVRLAGLDTVLSQLNQELPRILEKRESVRQERLEHATRVNDLLGVHGMLAKAIEQERQERVENAISRAIRFHSLSSSFLGDISQAATAMMRDPIVKPASASASVTPASTQVGASASRSEEEEEEEKHEEALEQLERLKTQMEVHAAVQLEQQERMVESTMLQAQEQAEREVARAWAQAAMDFEQEQRLAEEGSTSSSHQHRLPGHARAFQAAHGEQYGFLVVAGENDLEKEQDGPVTSTSTSTSTSMSVPAPSEWSLLGTNEEEFCSSAEEERAPTTSELAFKMEQQRRQLDDLRFNLHEKAERRVNQKRVTFQAELERLRRVQDSNTATAIENIERRFLQNRVEEMVEHERSRRLREDARPKMGHT